jgi:hypothetical protein
VTAIHNEQTKLLATALNNVAVAYVVIGFVTPTTALSFGVASAPPLQATTLLFVLLWLCAGAIIHWTARRVLRSLIL